MPMNCYENAMTMLQMYYGCTTGCRLHVTTRYYCHYTVYRYRGKVTWFADAHVARRCFELSG